MTSFSCCFGFSALSYHLGETSMMGFQQAHNGGCGRGPSFTTIENQSSSSCGCWPSSTMFRTANPYYYYNSDAPQRKKTTKTTTIMCFAPSLCISFPTTTIMTSNNVLSPPPPSTLLESKQIIHPVASRDCHTALKESTISASKTNNIPSKDHSLFGVSTSSLSSFFWPFRERTRTRVNDQERRTSLNDGGRDESNEEMKKVRIGIIGGGIAGVSVAHALTERLKLVEPQKRQKNDQVPPQYEIVLFEGDDGSCSSSSSTGPTWEAATARNANTLAVAASMHIFSTRDTLWMVAKDTCREWYDLFLEKISNEPKESCPKRLFQKSPPPYFALHPWACLGPNASHDEAMAFIRFSFEFVKAALWSGKEATKLRERLHCQLAKANRIMYLNEIERHQEEGSSLSLKNQIGHSKGFLGTYRSLEAAKANVNDALMHGEEASLLEWKEAAKMEPHLTNIHLEAESELHKPVSLFVVQRPNDYTASCETFIKHWTNQIKNRGVTIQHNKVKKIEKVPKSSTSFDNKLSDSTSTQYQVILQEKDHDRSGTTDDPKQLAPFDIVVLACGINTPLVAASLGFGHLCPTYPLRGFSLTIHVDPKDEDEESSTRGDNATSSSSKNNLLCQPFSLDNIYCTSVGPNMARLAGFGEFVGFRSPYTETIPSIGPSVLHRYAHMYFPSLQHNGHTHAIAKSCFRPLSPDDLPLIGSIQDAPNIFLHTGHGTFGWTTGLQTGDCVAQDIVHYLTKEQSIEKDGVVNKDHHEQPTDADASLYYDLADGSRISKASVSPNRFA